MCLLPLPHPSGVSRWLNDPAHRALVDKALAQLAIWRVVLALEGEATHPLAAEQRRDLAHVARLVDDQ